jgi:putative ABC transport system permease protein
MEVKKMRNLFKIAIRNLMRYKRRTLLTASLISIGVIFVLTFTAVTTSFKNMMIGEITDSMLGHVQIHKKGYVASIDNLPLNLNLKADQIKLIEEVLAKNTDMEAYSPRIKFGGMFSNFAETTTIRLNGIDPKKEFATTPRLTARVSSGKKDLEKGEIFIPVLLSTGMGVKVGDTIVIVTTNQDGSVNGKQFKVAGILESATGPGGRDGYVHISDARELLRMDDMQVSEYAIRLKDFSKLYSFNDKLGKELSGQLNKMGNPIFEVHTWEMLTPFYHIARMITAMTFFIKLMLIAIVLISIMNVMIMAVYERIREIGTIAAIGTLPRKILAMFLIEGLCLGIIGAIIGTVLGSLIVYVLNISKITFSFAQHTGYVLTAQINLSDILTISATVIIVSVIASLQPAYKASKMEPIKALRHV